MATGQAIYRLHCASCHGAEGQGVAKVHEKPLHGERPLRELVELIDETMPDEKPQLCTGEDAEAVARYVYESFYTVEARARRAPPRIELSRLTVRQYRHSVADLLAGFLGTARAGQERGLRGTYYKTRQTRSNEQVDSRVDDRVDFDYGHKSPHPKITGTEEFSIRWEGSLIAEDAGDHELTVVTDIGARLWVNGRDVPLIDAWVSSQGPPQEHTAVIRLLGGRAYPLRLDVFKYKDEAASIVLMWKPPHKARQVIGRRNLSPEGVPRTFVVSTPFPPDDRVSGYERGTGVSASWDRATTDAALETAAFVADRLDRLTGAGNRDRRRGRGRRESSSDRGDPGEANERARRFCRQFAERAFRRPLSPAEQGFFVDAHFASTDQMETAVKRCVLLVLKSPRFLYPALGGDSPEGDGYDAAARLALSLWDSLPDQTLLDAASRGELKTADQIARQAERMLGDPRARAKLRHFLHDWLQLDEKEGLTKDPDLFPDFDEQMAADLRTSLDLFLDEVVWSEQSDYRELLTADYVYLNSRLAKFYGVDVPGEPGFHKVVLDPGQRAGVVTHPYLLSMLAYRSLSSPIHRGVFVTRRLLGRTLRPPPQATEFKEGDFDPHLSTREKVALLTKPAACNTCHQVINPLGFSLEHFDAVGRYREKERDRPIDAAADFTTLAGHGVRLSGARSLARFAAGSRQAQGAFVDQLFHQAVKQPINAFGPEVRGKLIDAFAAGDYNIRKLLVEIVKVSALYRPAEKP